MVFLMALEMLVEVIDTAGQQRDLNLGRAGVAFMASIGIDDFLLVHLGIPPVSLFLQARFAVGVFGRPSLGIWAISFCHKIDCTIRQTICKRAA